MLLGGTESGSGWSQSTSRLSRKKLIILSLGVAFVLATTSVVPTIASLFTNAPSNYAASFTVAGNLNDPTVIGISGNLLVITESIPPSAPTTTNVETLNLQTQAINPIASFSGSGVVVGRLANDSAGDIFYLVAAPTGEQIVEQTRTNTGFGAPISLYSDSLCFAFSPTCPANDLGGITGLVSDTSGDIYFAENYPDGTSAIVELSAGDYTAPSTLLTLAGTTSVSGVRQITLAGDSIYFISRTGSSTEQVNSFDLRTRTTTTLLSVPVGANAAYLPYLAAGPGQSASSTTEVYYLYRVSAGPTQLLGGPSGSPPAQFVLGGFSTSIPTVTRTPPGQLPGEIASETFTPPTSVAMGLALSQGLMQVSPSGDVFFFYFPYTTPGVSSGNWVVEWYNSANSRFSQVYALSFYDSTNFYNITFAVDSSGNLYVATGGTSIIEITF